MIAIELEREGREERARNLAANGLNGLRMLRLDLVPPPPLPALRAEIDLSFINDVQVAAILAAALAAPRISDVIRVKGGVRARAGNTLGAVQVTNVAAGATADRLRITVAPVGDYSTYLLEVVHPGVDPIFAELPFKFRPACFFGDCLPPPPNYPAEPSPRIDYLAKDYESFKHLLITWMQQKVPSWSPTSEADLGQTLLELFAARGDELSDFQDRVMNEAYLSTARRRVSVTRHARLVDYHVHQGRQAAALIAFELQAGQTTVLPARSEVWTEGDPQRRITFATLEAAPLHHLLNARTIHTWSDAKVHLPAGSTVADLFFGAGAGSQNDAIAVADWIRQKNVPALLIEERLSPVTGVEAGRNPRKKQRLELIHDSPIVAQDPLTGDWYVRVRWRDEDRLTCDYCFVAAPPGQPRIRDVSVFRGNLAQAGQGRWTSNIVYREPGASLLFGERYFRRPQRGGALIELPMSEPLLYRPVRPGGDDAPVSTLEIEVVTTVTEIWEEEITFVGAEDNAHIFTVETEAPGESTVRFGDGIQGSELPQNARVICRYQTGLGPEGNVGAETLTGFDPAAHPELRSVRNPLDAFGGLGAEPLEEVLRAAPEAYRARQQRAVTVADYVRRAEEVEGVSRAHAGYAWTGSWRTVRVAIDPIGTEDLSPNLAAAVSAHLEPLRLIGDDLEIRGPQLVPLEITLRLCAAEDTWPEDLRPILEEELSAGFTRDGRPGLFHPDAWTFGQALRRSQIMGRIFQARGVDHVLELVMRRLRQAAPADPSVLEVRDSEIIQVRSDPDHLERGFVRLQIEGGRR